MIQIEGLHLSIGDTPILQDVSAQIHRGGITALIGPNGAGKSTLLHCLAGLNAPDAGKVRIDDRDPFGVTELQRARIVALLQQSPGIVSRLSVADLVAFGRWPHHRGRPSPEDRSIVEEALDAFDLIPLRARPLESLSGGQRQRAFVAMTYAQDTPWILLDEPLNALDPKHARNLMARLEWLVASRGRSIVIVLHDINAAARWADYILAMKDGQVLQAGRPDTVLTPEHLRSLYDTDFECVFHGERVIVLPK